MLVLTRKAQQTIRVGENITITILRVKGQSVRVGIEAPRDIHVVRGELPPKGEEATSETEILETIEITTTPEVSTKTVRQDRGVESPKRPQLGQNLRANSKPQAVPISHRGLKSQVSARRVRAVVRLNGEPLEDLRRQSLPPLRSTLGYH